MGFTAKNGKYFAVAGQGKKYDSDMAAMKLPKMDDSEDEDGEAPVADVHEVHINVPAKSLKTKHADGSTKSHSYEDLEDLHSKLDKFLDSEEKEWEENPEEEEEAHKDDFDSEDSGEDNPMSKLHSLMK
jgi:hypothetical protein